MIPAILHQTWKAAPLPARLQRYQASWRRFNPQIDYRFYDDADCWRFVGEHFPRLLSVYATMSEPVRRADFFRYLVVYECGGLYADIDTECLRPIDRFFAGSGLLLSTETKLTATRARQLGYAGRRQVANCIFAAEPRHPFLEQVILRVADEARLDPAASGERIEDVSGPRLLTRMLDSAPRPDVHVLNQIFWMAPTLYPNLPPLNRHMFARHHFLGSWKSKTRRSLVDLWVRRSRLPNPFPATVEEQRGP